MISVVIPVKDGGQDLVRCLSAIRAQTVEEPVEIVIVDSGSSDGSREVARRHGARIQQIDPLAFGHGVARNLGAEKADGEVLVFISQDAYPLGPEWLARLVGHLHEDSSLGGVYGRQLPHEGAKPPEVFFLDFLYGPEPRLQQVRSQRELSMDTTLFSNVNSAMRKEVWERFPFAEDIIMSEDQEWSQRVLLAGLRVMYEPLAVVRHSHNYTMRAAFQRFFDSGVSAERAYLAGNIDATRVLRGRALDYARREVGWLARSGQTHWIPYAALYESAKMAGLVLGANHSRLPKSVNRRLSALKSHWDRVSDAV